MECWHKQASATGELRGPFKQAGSTIRPPMLERGCSGQDASTQPH